MPGMSAWIRKLLRWTPRRWLPWLVLLLAVVSSLPYFSTELPPSNGAGAVVQAFEQRRSGVWVETQGTVVRLLRDDLDGDRHQRFIVELPGGLSVLVSHNIDLAPRLPLQRGDQVALRGRYEWNEKGGVIHWTHHDPRERREGGWIQLDGRRYQ